ncbi:MAG: DUF3631 domain-containing protein [Halieaceae bacterium]|uniref:DUF3631 domain-containing protein n=1 Tax=Haliea alexandrii TaxID=2448162 RepID=UPI000F0B55F2|nr:DUF3631 domain-containing protein [Haliea alexandrii]MCR9186622.1 DUF3631 domain-containing protein [Halieaceae bacterium]
MSMLPEGAVDSAEKIEGDVLAACKQNQDIPIDLRDDSTKTDAGIQTVLGGQAAGGAQAPPAEPATQMVEVIKRYCVLTEYEVDAMALWLIASYIIDDFRVFSKLALISPEKRCGKTTTMEVTSSMAKDGQLMSNMTKAILYRITEKRQPTLFIDEADTFLKNGDSDLNGLINSSHTKAAAKVMRCDGDNFEAREFSTWMPMVLASIGDLPGTLMDRSIVINLRRKKSYEHTEEVPVDLQDLNEPLRQTIAAWVAANRTLIRNQSVQLPKVGNDRAGDNWKPLFQVAAVLGEPWLGRCEKACRELTVTAEPELQTMLLRDIQQFFLKSGSSRATSKELCEALISDEDGPWKTCNTGKPITPNLVGKLLRPYGVKPKTIRVGDKTLRGYEHAQLEDAFERYLA